MRSCMVLLVLVCEGVFAQSQEPSKYDKNVTDAFTSCTSSANAPQVAAPELEQLTGTTAKASVAGDVELMYLVDQDGTVLDATTANSASFDWSEFEGTTPTTIAAWVIYPNCQTTSNQSNTWAGKVAAELENLDPLATPSDLEAEAPKITVTTDSVWVGGTYKVEYQGACNLLAWAETDGIIQNLQEGSSTTVSALPFGKGAVTLTACQLCEMGKICSTVDLASDYVEKLGEPAQTVADFKSKFSAGKQGSGKNQVNTLKPCIEGAEGCTLKDADCAEWFIYAKTGDNLTASGFTSMLTWKQELTSYTAYLSCGDGTFQSAEVNTIDLPTVALSIEQELIVGYPACNVSGTQGASGTSFKLDDGRNCTCVMGNAQCDAKGTKSEFRLSDGEAVGLALSVSVIVLIIIMAIIFLILKKSAQKREGGGAVLKSTQDDHL